MPRIVQSLNDLYEDEMPVVSSLADLDTGGKRVVSSLADLGEPEEDMSGFERGIHRGWENLQATGYGAAGLVGSALRIEPLEEWGFEGYQRNIEEAAQYPKETEFKEIKGLTSALGWAGETAGELVPSMGEAAVGAALGATLGSAAPGPGTAGGAVAGFFGKRAIRKMIKEAVGRFVKKGMTREAAERAAREQIERIGKSAIAKQAMKQAGAKAGIVSAVAPIEAGGNWGEAMERGIDNPWSALATGTLAAFVELAGGNARLIDKTLGGKAGKAFRETLDRILAGNGTPKSVSLVARMVKEAAKQAPGEALQESTQELLSMANIAVNDPTFEKFTQENLDRLIESGAAGAVGGLGGGMVSGIATPKGTSADQAKQQILSGIQRAYDTGTDEQGRTFGLDELLELKEDPRIEELGLDDDVNKLIIDAMNKQPAEPVEEATEPKPVVSSLSDLPAAPEAEPIESVSVMLDKQRARKQAQQRRTDLEAEFEKELAKDEEDYEALRQELQTKGRERTERITGQKPVYHEEGVPEKVAAIEKQRRGMEAREEEIARSPWKAAQKMADALMKIQEMEELPGTPVVIEGVTVTPEEQRLIRAGETPQTFLDKATELVGGYVGPPTPTDERTQMGKRTPMDMLKMAITGKAARFLRAGEVKLEEGEKSAVETLQTEGVRHEGQWEDGAHTWTDMENGGTFATETTDLEEVRAEREKQAKAFEEKAPKEATDKESLTVESEAEGTTGKEPWEMTAEEWRESQEYEPRIVEIAERMSDVLRGKRKRPSQGEMRELRDLGLADTDNTMRVTAFALTPKGQELISHRREVVSALREGKSVPASVLKDYPDLQAQEKTEKEAKPRSGKVWIDNKVYPFTESREIKRGKNKGKVEVVVRGKKKIVEGENVKEWPKGETGELLAKKGKKARGTPLTRRQARQAITPFTKRLRSRGIDLTVRVVEDAGSLTLAQQAQLDKSAPQWREGSLKGALIDKKHPEVLIFSKAFTRPEDVVVTFFHEARGHYSLRKVFGSRLNGFLEEVYATKGEEGLQDLIDEYFGDKWENTRRQQRVVAEEYLARIAESGKDPNLLKRLYAKIREILRNMGVTLRLTDADLQSIVSGASREALGKVAASAPMADIMASLTSKEGPAAEAVRASLGVEGIESLQKIHDASSPIGSVRQPLSEASSLSNLLERFGTGVERSNDMRAWRKTFQLPYWVGKKYPTIGQHVAVEIDAGETRSRELHDDYETGLGEIQDSIPKDKKASKELNDTIWKWEGKRFPKKDVPTDAIKFPSKGEEDLTLQPEHYQEARQFLKKQGVSEQVINAFLNIREVLDRKLIDLDQTMRVEKLDPDLIEQYRSEVGKIHNYFPHKRDGDAYIKITKKDDPFSVVYREHFWKYKEIGKSKENKAKGRAEAWLRKAVREGRLTGKMGDYEVGRARELTQLPDEVFFSLDINAMQQIAGMAGQHIKADQVQREMERIRKSDPKLTEDEARTQATKNIRGDIEKALSEAISNVVKSRGFGQHAIGRSDQFIAGFETEDIFGTLFDYLSGYAGFKTKIQRARAHTHILNQIDARENPNEYRYASKYVRDVLRNQDKTDRVVDSIRGLFFVKYLGFVPKSAIVNLTQNVVAAAPILSQYTKGSHRKLAKAMADTRRALTSKEAWTGKQIHYKHLKEIEQTALRDMHEEGATIDQYLRELKGDLPRRGWGKYLKKFVDKSGIFMGLAEKYNRTSTGLAAFRIAYNDGVDFQGGTKGNYNRSIDFAKQIILDSHFLYGKANLPEFARGGDFQKYARSAYTFRSFTHNYLSMVAHLVSNQGPAGKRAVAYSLRNLIIIAGLSGIPFFNAFSNALLWALGDDDEDAMTKARELMPHNWLKDMIVYGLPGASAGVDLTGSLSIEVPKSWKDLLGVPYSAMEDTVNMIQSLKSGQIGRAFSESPVTPLMVRNAMRGHTLYTEGQRTRSGRNINYPGKVGARKITAPEMVGKALGFQPISSSKSYAAYQAVRKAEESVQEKKRHLADEYANAFRKNDRKTMDKVLQSVREWNSKALKNKEYWKVIDLKSSIRNRLRPAFSQIPKKMRGEATRIYEEWR
jgi:hypothetical protein